MPSGSKKKQVGWESTTGGAEFDDDEDGMMTHDQFGFKREKSECKLL